MDIKRRGPKFTPEELTSLQSIVEKFLNVIENKKTDKYWNRKKQQAWFLVAQEYNAQFSVQRSELNLQNAYRNMKIRTKKSSPAGQMTSTVKDEKLKPQSISMEKKYKAVLKCCINLVKVHGRPVEIFDDKAFQDLLDMIPITVKERRKLTADNIKIMIEEGNSGAYDDDDDEWDTSFDTARDHLADYDSTPIRVKRELVKCSCPCPSRSEPVLTAHVEDCPQYTSPTYWSFFSVSVEDATCSLCGEVIMWSELSELKTHLTIKHPGTKFVDDDEQFSRGPPSSVGSREERDELMLPEDLPPEPRRPTATADLPEPRRPTDLPALSRPGRRRLSQPHYRKIAPRPAAVYCVGNSEDPVDKSFLDRCKSLDSFGAYVASLMKLLPEDVCTKLQRHIVDRVLAAAG